MKGGSGRDEVGAVEMTMFPSIQGLGAIGGGGGGEVASSVRLSTP